MKTLQESAFAKINLTLDVLDKRTDGYHNIKSIMQTISLRDDVEIDSGTGRNRSAQVQQWVVTGIVGAGPTIGGGSS